MTYEERLLKMGKKVHYRTRVKTAFFGIQNRPVCRVDNKTTTYIATGDKKEITCNRCLKWMATR